MKHIKKSLAIILAVIMALSAFSVLPVTVNAAVSDNASVGAETFVCGDFKYQVLSDDTANITKYTGSETDLVLPPELDGHKVDTLYYNSLNGCSAVTSITIPDSESGISVVGKISDNITLSVKKTDTSDNENILAQYKIDFIAPNDTVVKPYSTVQVSIPCTEQKCSLLLRTTDL